MNTTLNDLDDLERALKPPAGIGWRTVVSFLFGFCFGLGICAAIAFAG